MTDHDPVDALLRNAFAADLERTETPPVVARAMARIRRQQRIRLLTVASALLVGLLLLAASVQPALAVLTEALRQYLPQDLHDNLPMLAVLAALGATWLLVLDGEPA